MGRGSREREPETPSTVPTVLPAIVCLGILVLAVSVLLADVLFGGKGLVPADGITQFPPWKSAAAPPASNPGLADQYLEFVPARQFFHDEAVRGRFPLWNPRIACGVPSLASMQGAALYPVNLLLSPLSPFVASGLAAFLKLLLAGCFTFLYVRRLGAANAAALVAAITFTFSGFIIVWLGHPHTNSAVLLPMLFYFCEGVLREARDRRSWAGLAAAFGVVLLGGHAPTVVHMTIALGLYAIVRLKAGAWKERFVVASALVTALAAGAAIAAPQLLPFAEYYGLSSSRQSSEALGRWASHLEPAAAVNIVLPYAQGDARAGFDVAAPGPNGQSAGLFNERTSYAGVLPLFLALVALTRRRDRASFFFGGLALVAVFGIFGVPPWPALIRHVPILSSINHGRLILWVDWTVAVLAGLGADTLLRLRPGQRPVKLAAAFALGTGAFAGLAWATGLIATAGAGSFWISPLVQFAVLAGGLACAIAISRRRLANPWVVLASVGWTTVELLWFAVGVNPAVRREAYYPATPAIRFLQQDRSAFRIFGASTVLMPNTPGMFGLDDVRGRDFMNLARYEELITGRAGSFFFYQTGDHIPPSFGLLNAKYIVVPKAEPAAPAGLDLVYDAEVAVYRYAKARPRAVMVFDARVEPDERRLLNRIRDPQFDPAAVVWLEHAPVPVAAPPSTPVQPADAAAEITSRESDEVTVEVQAPRDGFLVLFDTHFPGWVADVDGVAAPLYRADYAFRAVPVPRGSHIVRFRYKPWSFRAGVVLSLTAIAFVSALTVRRRRVSEPAAPAPAPQTTSSRPSRSRRR